MKPRKILTIAVLALAAGLLVMPAQVAAERNIKRFGQVFGDSDPEVPDRTGDRSAYTGASQSTIHDDARAERRDTVSVVRPEAWYQRLLRILRALTWGGPVR